MATPRRSSRLRSHTPQKENNESTPPRPLSVAKLSSLVERDETPNRGIQTNLDSIASASSSKHQTPRLTSAKTPTTASRVKPDSAQMHPGHHQSANKSAKRKLSAPSASKENGSENLQEENNPFSSPQFEFTFKRPSYELSPDGKKIMDQVREQAARIKDELAAQRDAQLKKDQEAEALHGVDGRKIATPKGKVGRFSDAHMKQFKKMDSIANHASSFRGDSSKWPSPGKSLKRSNSKAGLDAPDSDAKSASPEKLASPDKFALDATIDNKPFSPSKRVKRQTGLPSPARPSSSKGSSIPSKPSTPNLSRSNSGIPTIGIVSTPTKASLARSASVKSFKSTKSLIPSLTRTPSAKSLTTPTKFNFNFNVPHTEGSHKYRNAIANKLTNVKSILRRPQLRFSDDPIKVAAGTHMATPKSKGAGADKPLPDKPKETPGTPAHRIEKHVNFSIAEDAVPSPRIGTPATPSPAKLARGYPLLGTDVSYPSLPTATPPQATQPDSAAVGTPKYALPVPGDFTFRAEQTISFASAPTTPTIRKVEVDATPVFASSKPAVDGVSHGLSNKKRKRETEEDDENKENEADAVVESPSKRVKVVPTASVVERKAARASRGNAKGRGGGRGVLSLSRLNALARPKERR